MKAKTNDKLKTCESCGKDFNCGANTKKCWCFEIDLNAETLAKLQEDFKSCLCVECLKKIKVNI
jgi:Cysteine-rich CWC